MSLKNVGEDREKGKNGMKKPKINPPQKYFIFKILISFFLPSFFNLICGFLGEIRTFFTVISIWNDMY